MVIVTGEYRQRGIASRLLDHCAETLRAKGLVPGLDATEAGREVYRPLGFREVYGLSRMFRGTDSEHDDPAEAPAQPEGLLVRPIEQEDFEALCRWDRPVFGADRSAILRHLQTRLPEQALLAERGGRIMGFVMARDGREAVYIGPLVAEDTETAIALGQSALAGVTGAVYLDVADRHEPLLAMLAERGFSRQRTYSRMLLHHDRPFDDPEKVYAIAGPELG